MLDTWHKDIRQTLKDTVTELRHDACRIYCGYIMVLKIHERRILDKIFKDTEFR